MATNYNKQRIEELKKIVKKLKWKIVKGNPYLVKKKLEMVEKMIEDGLPETFRPSLNYLITGRIDDETKNIVERIEAIRNSIASHGDKKISIWYSPKPGSSGSEVKANMNPKPGKVLEFTMEQVARTGKSRRWGIYIHLLVKSFKLKNVFELGSCAGISGCYLSSTRFIEHFITVEGSAELAKVAEESIKKLNCKAIVLNSLFENAIDSDLRNMNLKLDCIFIDGHHEKSATIHYYEKLKPFLNPNSIVIFDDISWSYDMRDAWNILSRREDFAHSLDLGAMGVCIYGQNKKNKYWDFQSILGKVKIGDPYGWKDNWHTPI